MYQCRDKNDKPKKRYNSEQEAQSVVDYEQLERDVSLSVYQCQECSRWHITSNS
jgi:hypothetical protein